MSDFEFEVIMSEDYSDEADLEWVPPTEAEQKVIAARRERSDKISKLMGEYMLKGYKMLATTCPKCGTIELEDKQSRIYCVACEEVDSEENSKDNPAVNQRAARNQIAEGQLEDIESQIEEVVEVAEERRISQNQANPTLFQPSQPLRNSRGVRPVSTQVLSQPLPVVHSSLDAVFAKMAAASESLASTEDIETSRQLVTLIKDCADCVQALKGASNILNQ